LEIGFGVIFDLVAKIEFLGLGRGDRLSAPLGMGL
jgi:hypothetical protein